MLNTWIQRENIVVKQEAADWREAIRMAAAPLLQHGAVEGRYVEAMIRSVEELGPYIAIAPGVAIAHARPESGVLRCAIGFATLARPVPFGSRENDPISLIVTLAALDHDAHIDAMGELMGILGDEEKRAAIEGAPDGDVLYRLLDLEERSGDVAEEDAGRIA